MSELYIDNRDSDILFSSLNDFEGCGVEFGLELDNNGGGGTRRDSKLNWNRCSLY